MELWDANKILKNIVLLFVILFVIKYTFSSDAFRSKDYKGKGFSVRKPAGWEMVLDDKDAGIFVTESMDSGGVTFLAPNKNTSSTQAPTRISVYEAKLQTPAWVDDIFPEIIRVLVAYKAKIKDKGELKIDGQISKWILYSLPGSRELFLEFFVADEKNGIFKLRLTGEPEGFMKYRKTFDDLRGSFLFSKALF